MGKRSHKPMKLDAAPLLLTDVFGSEWRGGVLMVNVSSGDVRGTLALTSEACLRMLQVAASASSDNLAPFNRTRRVKTD